MIDINVNYKIAALGVAILVFIAYNWYVIKEYGIQKSMSWSYYVIENKWLFQAFIYVLSACIILAGCDYYTLAAGLLLSLVGLAPTVKETYIKVIHSFGAVLSILVLIYYVLFILSDISIIHALGLLVLLVFNLIMTATCRIAIEDDCAITLIEFNCFLFIVLIWLNNLL